MIFIVAGTSLVEGEPSTFLYTVSFFMGLIGMLSVLWASFQNPTMALTSFVCEFSLIVFGMIMLEPFSFWGAIVACIGLFTFIVSLVVIAVLGNTFDE